jgi:hypothetical protein
MTKGRAWIHTSLFFWAIAVMIAFLAALLIDGNPLAGLGRFTTTMVLFVAIQSPIWISRWRQRNC